eukprot:scaffold32524_cov33-Phaeocystis_antarctica.AAC.1
MRNRFFTPGTTCLARVLAGPSRCTRAVHWARKWLAAPSAQPKADCIQSRRPKGRSKLAFKGYA